MLPENDPWLPPYRIPEFRNALKGYVRAAGLPFLDIPELTEDYYPSNNPLFIERVHPNYDGHKMIAQRLHDLLRPIVEKRLAAAK
jgi:lysophospholipase L1-like esterase